MQESVIANAEHARKRGERRLQGPARALRSATAYQLQRSCNSRRAAATAITLVRIAAVRTVLALMSLMSVRFSGSIFHDGFNDGDSMRIETGREEARALREMMHRAPNRNCFARAKAIPRTREYQLAANSIPSDKSRIGESLLRHYRGLRERERERERLLREEHAFQF